MSEKTVEINGTLYDKQTGMPIRHTETAALKRRSYAGSLHSRTQRSSTLNRAYVHREPRLERPAPAQVSTEKKATKIAVTSAEHVRSPMIQKYAKHPTPAVARPVESIAPPAIHPMVQRVQAAQAVKQAPKRAIKPSDIIKAEAVQEALEKAPKTTRAPHRDKLKNRTKKQRANRALSFASSGVALLLIAGYFTYMNMPNLSVRVAAVQAGVHASYPSYRPSGYSLSGPISYGDNRVEMKFAGHGLAHGFTLTQSKSGWDSAAVLENYVQPKTGDSYTTTAANGLTIYSWDSNAAWINDGILYTLDGDAPLTPEQIQRIAASM